MGSPGLQHRSLYLSGAVVQTHLQFECSGLPLAVTIPSPDLLRLLGNPMMLLSRIYTPLNLSMTGMATDCPWMTTFTMLSNTRCMKFADCSLKRCSSPCGLIAFPCMANPWLNSQYVEAGLAWKPNTSACTNVCPFNVRSRWIKPLSRPCRSASLPSCSCRIFLSCDIVSMGFLLQVLAVTTKSCQKKSLLSSLKLMRMGRV